MIAARKRHDEVLIFSTVLDPNFCFQYCFKNLLTPQAPFPTSPCPSPSLSPQLASPGNDDVINEDSFAVVQNVILQAGMLKQMIENILWKKIGKLIWVKEN